MNEILERLKERNKDITKAIVTDFIFHMIAIIVFSCVVFIIISAIGSTTKILHTILLVVEILLCAGLIVTLFRAHIETIKSLMRSYKCIVDLAIRHLENEKFMKDKIEDYDEHIPRID